MPREVIIGTSDAEATGKEAPQERPEIAVVAAHVQRLRAELCGHHASTRDGYAAHVHLPASDLARVALLVDLLDQLRYWSVEEASTFLQLPSCLAETEAPEAVVACLCSGRPQLIAQALTVVQPMLWHPQTASEMRRVLRDVRQHHQHSNKKSLARSREEREQDIDDRGNTGSAVDDTDDLPGDPLLVFLAEAMLRHAGAAPLLTEALSTATTVVQVVQRDIAQGETDADVLRHVHGVFDVLCATPLVFAMESAMRRFADTVQLQVSGAAFFAALVDLPALQEEAGDAEWRDAADERSTRERALSEEEIEEDVAAPSPTTTTTTISMAEVVAHSDGVMEVLQAAMARHHQHLALRRSVLHLWCVCAQNPACRLSLLRHGVYGSALRLLCEVGPYTLDVSREAAETVGYFTSLLDALQRRSLLLALRGILQRRPQLAMIEVVLALLVAVLTVVDGHQLQMERGEGDRRRGAEARSDPFARYAMCPQPPTTSPAAPQHGVTTGPQSTEGINGVASPYLPRQRGGVCVQLSPVYWQPSPCAVPSIGGSSSSLSAKENDTWWFMLHHCAVPQLVSGVRDYFLACEVIDEEDAAEVQRVCALADAVLSFF